MNMMMNSELQMPLLVSEKKIAYAQKAIWETFENLPPKYQAFLMTLALAGVITISFRAIDRGVGIKFDKEGVALKVA